MDDDSSMNCNICFNILSNPRRACQTGHVYCQTCLIQHVTIREETGIVPTCPDCRGTIVHSPNGEIGAPQPMLSHVLASLTAPCSYGCGTVIPLRDMNEHRTSCPRAPVKCVFEHFGCRWEGRRCDLEDHIHKDMATHILIQSKWFGENHSELCTQMQTSRRNTNACTAQLDSHLGRVQAVVERVEIGLSQMNEKMNAIGTALAATMEMTNALRQKRKAEFQPEFDAARKNLCTAMTSESTAAVRPVRVAETPPPPTQPQPTAHPPSAGQSNTVVGRMQADRRPDPIFVADSDEEAGSEDEENGVQRSYSPSSPSYQPTSHRAYQPTSPFYNEDSDDEDASA